MKLKMQTKVLHPFRVIVQKETADHIRSWRFLVLIILIALTCLGSMYTALANIKDAIKPNDPEDIFLFLKLFTVSDGTLPSFFVFIVFLGPLLGIGLGFDAVNSEFNRGTISRILSQPVPRDYLINAKFTSALTVIGVMFISLSLLVTGIGLLSIGILPTPEEFIRIMLFTLAGMLYVGFWLNLSIFLSIRFQQPATSALTSIGIWLFFSVFYPLLTDMFFKIVVPSGKLTLAGEKLKLGILRLAPNQLFSDVTTGIMMPKVRSIGPLTMQQMQGALPEPIPVGQSIMLVWPQLTALVALTVLCFLLSYLSFMRKEIR